MCICNADSNLIPRNGRDSNRDSKFPKDWIEKIADFSMRTKQCKENNVKLLENFEEDVNHLCVIGNFSNSAPNFHVLLGTLPYASCLKNYGVNKKNPLSKGRYTKLPSSFLNFAICGMFEEKWCQQKETCIIKYIYPPIKNQSSVIEMIH